MTETKWTPGPWFAVNDGTKREPMMAVKAARISGQTPRHEVAICATGDSPQEMENANANLMAASPDLYAALKETLEIAARHESGEYIERANAAMRKARGGE